jgi:hypothetical protein
VKKEAGKLSSNDRLGSLGQAAEMAMLMAKTPRIRQRLERKFLRSAGRLETDAGRTEEVEGRVKDVERDDGGELNT